MKRAYHVAAARIVDRAGGGFRIDPMMEILTYILLPSLRGALHDPYYDSRAGEYDGMKCEVCDLVTWVNGGG